jgi:hypothetical protein
VIELLPAEDVRKPPLGGKVLVATASSGPSDAAVRVATLLARPDGGHSDILITRAETEPPLEPALLRDLQRRIVRHGFDGNVRTEVNELPAAVSRAVLAGDPSLVIVDDPTFDSSPGRVPVLVVDAPAAGSEAVRLIADGEETNGVAEEIERRLARGGVSPPARAARRARPGSRS